MRAISQSWYLYLRFSTVFLRSLRVFILPYIIWTYCNRTAFLIFLTWFSKDFKESVMCLHLIITLPFALSPISFFLNVRCVIFRLFLLSLFGNFKYIWSKIKILLSIVQMCKSSISTYSGSIILSTFTLRDVVKEFGNFST